MSKNAFAFLVFFGLVLISCGNDDDTTCNDFTLQPCDISDEVELALVRAILDDRASSFYDIQLLQSTQSIDFSLSYEVTMQSCGYEIDHNATMRLMEINATTHTWCTNLIGDVKVISNAELDCLYSEYNGHQEKHPNTRIYRFSRPVIDKNGRAFISFDDGCRGYRVILEMKQNNWEIVCGGPVLSC